MSSLNTLAKGVLALGLSLSAAACATTPEMSAPMAIGPQAPAPRGFVEFCERLPTDCGATPAELSALREEGVRQRAAVILASLARDWSSVYAASARGSGPTSAVAFPAVVPAAAAASPPTASVAPAPTESPADVQLSAGKVELTPDAWTLITRTNDRVNRAIAQKTDIEAYGVEELWTMPIEAGTRYGDCEDYVLEKRRALLAAGMPKAALSIAVVHTAKGDTHAVLLVDTSAGEYVLDNLTPWVLPWTKTSYQWRERQVAGSAAHWAMAAGVQLEPDTSRLLLASLR
ncbi:transglutaminase-like cysteine peptidase [Phenylobacterium sp. J367]|uniref:transglutaminase-like cysteine peptidase n=1 Tax=Phenylobacterium sp. J367 TaxID=2898435 RepID=UPI00215099B8|nr:transglutaminase-like cysteine peptidase [Phenylobacterium sp. J367]MCR5879520.1 transglutaminase-like cysteine peptidase [Phenylobacterium sp. J367]